MTKGRIILETGIDSALNKERVSHYLINCDKLISWKSHIEESCREVLSENLLGLEDLFSSLFSYNITEETINE